MYRIVLIILFFLVSKTFIFAEEQDEKSAPKKEFEKFKYFSFAPGVNFQSVDFIAKQGNRSAHMANPEGITSYSLDLKSRDFQISENFGSSLILYNGSLRLNKQFLSDPFSGSLTDESSPSPKKIADLGTDVRIDYSYLIPSFYFGKKDFESIRFGLGLGLGRTKVLGNMSFEDPIEYAFLLFKDNRKNLLDAITFKQYSTGSIDIRTGDPILNYLYLNLNSGNNLETLVLYMASQGLISFDTSDVIRYSIYSSVLGNTLTPTEL
ncbi:MAG: hypothetical protein SFU98_16810, partial [Leptospiraceae bacterium]|nr:hypothetical protein [Leptospiraceae bacterium]